MPMLTGALSSLAMTTRGTTSQTYSVRSFCRAWSPNLPGDRLVEGPRIPVTSATLIVNANLPIRCPGTMSLSSGTWETTGDAKRRRMRPSVAASFVASPPEVGMPTRRTRLGHKDSGRVRLSPGAARHHRFKLRTNRLLVGDIKYAVDKVYAWEAAFVTLRFFPCVSRPRPHITGRRTTLGLRGDQ